jgi:hypothetical protein
MRARVLSRASFSWEKPVPLLLKILPNPNQNCKRNRRHFDRRPKHRYIGDWLVILEALPWRPDG